MKPQTFKNLLIPFVVMLAFWGVAIWGFTASGYTMPLIMFGYIGTALGIGLGLYGTLPKKQKPIRRCLTLFLVGTFLIGFAVLKGRENSQLEGAFFGLLTGVIQMGVIHYAIAKIFGPLLFGRMLCGWACWTVMILDLLPFTRPSGRLFHSNLMLMPEQNSGFVLLANAYGFEQATQVADRWHGI